MDKLVPEFKYVNCALCPAQAFWKGTESYEPSGYNPANLRGKDQKLSFYRCPTGHETVVRERNEHS